MGRIGIAIALVACGWMGCATAPRGGARAQEAAWDLNTHARFGRMEIAASAVSAKEREAFMKRHRAWGTRIRIADTELAGIKMASETMADVMVRVGWYRPEQQELKSTTIRQKWREDSGDWLLVTEERVDGDVGLLGESVVVQAPEPQPPAQFRTIRIGAAD